MLVAYGACNFMLLSSNMNVTDLNLSIDCILYTVSAHTEVNLIISGLPVIKTFWL